MLPLIPRVRMPVDSYPLDADPTAAALNAIQLPLGDARRQRDHVAQLGGARERTGVDGLTCLQLGTEESHVQSVTIFVYCCNRFNFSGQKKGPL